MAEVDPVDAVKVIVGILLVVGIGSLVLGEMGAVFTDDAAGIETIEPSTEGTLIDYRDDIPEDLNVSPTAGHAVHFDGSGHVEHDAPSDWATGDWGVCTTAYLGDDDGANQDATYNLFAYDNRTIVLEYAAGEWRAIHEHNGSTATATTPANVSEQTPICADWTASSNELSLFVDGDLDDTANLTATDPNRQVASDWVGWVDEVRLFNATVGSNVASAYASNPVDPLAEMNHSARMMFDEGAGDTSVVYYQDASASLIGTQWGSGVASPSLEEGVDYEVSADPFRVRAVEDGLLDGQTIAYVTWPGQSMANVGVGIFGLIGSVLRLLLIVAVVVGGSVAVKALDSYD